MIHICFNLDEKYVTPCKVLIREILATTSEECTFHFIGITKRDMGAKNTHFYPNPDLSYFNKNNLTDYYYFSKAAMYRLLIPFLIKTDKALYLDIDVVIKKDIKTLWDKKIDYVGAVVDPCNLYHNSRLGIIGANEYYNSGVILFNSKVIRKNMPDYKERILKAQEDYVLDLKDQDIFNIVFQDHITNLGYEYNIDSHNLKEKDETKVISQAKDIAYKDPTIIHCMGKEKYWTLKGLYGGDTWDYYAKELIPPNRKQCIIKGDLYIIRN